MNRYNIKYIQNGEESNIYIVCADEDHAIMFFEIAFDGAIFLSIERAVVQIITTKPCLN
jgi:hypothetical protein